MTDKDTKELEVSKKKEIETQKGEPARQDIMYVPEVDITETDENMTLYADVPGVRPDGVDIDVGNGTLTLTARVDPPAASRRAIYREYGIGGYQRSFILGDQIDADKIEAALHNGVLTVILPKSERHKPRKIQVQI